MISDKRLINLADGEAFESSLGLLLPEQQENYDQAFSDYKSSGKNAARYTEDYYANARFIVYSEPGFAQKFCRCGMTSILNRSGACGMGKWCSRCAHLKAWKAATPFNNSFREDEFHFVTLSYKEGLSFDLKRKSEYYWKAPMKALGKLKERNLIQGAVINGEMAVLSFMPVRLNPHVHAIVHAPCWEDANNEELEKLINKSLLKSLGEHHRAADVQSVLIKDQAGLEGCFYYMMKPMDLATAYYSAWNQHHESPEGLDLNEQLKEFVRSTPGIAKSNEQQTNMHLLRRLGTMRLGSKVYIGKKRKKRKKGKPQCRPRPSSFHLPALIRPSLSVDPTREVAAAPRRRGDRLFQPI